MLEAYATAEYADEYLDSLTGAEAWSSASSADKKRALATATMRIDALGALGGGFRGRKAEATQTLEFPREGQNEPPEAVKRACCHEALALVEMTADTAAKRRERDRRQGVTAVSIGDVSESYKSTGKSDTLALYSDLAFSLLLPYRAAKGVYPIT